MSESLLFRWPKGCQAACSRTPPPPSGQLASSVVSSLTRSRSRRAAFMSCKTKAEKVHQMVKRVIGKFFSQVG